MNSLNLPWNRWYGLKSYVGSSLWIVPVFAIVILFFVKRVTEKVGAWMYHAGFYDLKTGFFGLSMAGARASLETIVTANLSFLVFTFGSLLVAIQVASGQYTPRIIATTLLRDNPIRYMVGLFLFTLLFANRTLSYMGDTEVHQFQVFLAFMFGVASFIAFLYLIDYAARFLRPVSLVGLIGEQGIEVIDSVYPNPTRGVESLPSPRKRRARSPLAWVIKGDTGRAEARSDKRGAPDRTLTHLGRSKVLLAVNLTALVAEARRAGVVIELAPQVGDFVPAGEPLFYVYGDAGRIDEKLLREQVAFGTERTMEQDPMFSFRILVDIAAKALSPAINDPTTAVLAIDQLHRLLRLVGRRDLRAEEIADDTGEVRLIVRTPNWEDFVHIVFREIRLFGAGNLQIPRRLAAMIENLVQTLPEHRHAALRTELELLDRVIVEKYPYPEDLALARMPDPQGMGGSSRSQSAGR
jgi:uncharacterized membrane protein